MKLLFKKSFTIIFLLLIIIFMMNCGNSVQEHVVSEIVNTDKYLNHGDSAHYVGMSQCKLCHQDIYKSFKETGMGKSFEHANKEKSKGKFEKHTVIYDSFSDFYYHPFWDGDRMKILEFRLRGKDTIYQRVENVDFIIGSGQHTNSHMTNTNGYITQMPMTFYTQKGKWDLPPGFENGFNTRFSRKIGLECMSCHNSYPDYVEGSENKYNALPEGVSCERCHGPGSIHVQQRSTGSQIDTSKYIDYSIVNPGKLAIDRQFDVCQRCHLQGNAVLKEGKSFYDFRPGMKLSDYMTVFLPRYKDADDQFIMASHADRLKQSQCFIKSYKPESDSTSLRPYKNSLTCVTCHNPHVSVKVTGKEVFNNACRNCHGGKGQKDCSELNAVRKKSLDNCVTCHMPKSGAIDIPHVTVHDHFIRKPLKKEEVAKVKEFIGLYAVNEKSPSHSVLAKAYIQQYDKFEYNPVFLDSAAYYLKDKSINDIQENFELLVHLNFIKQNYSKIVSIVNTLGIDYVAAKLVRKTWDNANAWTLYRIGESFYNTRDLINAHRFYKLADNLAPFNPEFKNKIGVSLMAQNKVPEAILQFEATLKENPKFVQAINNLGYAYLISGNEKMANELYNKGLSLDPDYEPLLLNVAGFNVYKKKYSAAKIILNQILKRNPKNEQAKQVLKQLTDFK